MYPRALRLLPPNRRGIQSSCQLDLRPLDVLTNVQRHAFYLKGPIWRIFIPKDHLRVHGDERFVYFSLAAITMRYFINIIHEFQIHANNKILFRGFILYGSI